MVLIRSVYRLTWASIKVSFRVRDMFTCGCMFICEYLTWLGTLVLTHKYYSVCLSTWVLFHAVNIYVFSEDDHAHK